MFYDFIQHPHFFIFVPLHHTTNSFLSIIFPVNIANAGLGDATRRTDEARSIAPEPIRILVSTCSVPPSSKFIARR